MVRSDLDRLAELEEERRFLLRSLDDLERERAAGDVDQHDYQDLKDGYTARAAEVLRALDDGRAAQSTPTLRRPGRVALTAAAVLAIAAIAGVAVARTAGQRLPGQGLTGNIAESTNSKLVQARQLLGTDRVKAAALYSDVLATQPDNAEALTYHAWLARLDTRAKLDAGTLTPVVAAPAFADVATGLARAMSVAPTYADPRCLAAVLRFRDLADPVGARRALDDCMDANPSTGMMSQVQTIGPEIDQALATADPVALQLSQAHRQSDPKAAIDLYDKVLASQPDNAEALTYRAWVTATVANDALQGQRIDKATADTVVDKAEKALAATMSAHPSYADPACFTAVIRADYHADLAGAKAPLVSCMADGPGPYLRTQLADLPTQLGVGP